MGFIKVQKNNAYFSRFQVQYRRRREGKTDFHARQVLVRQDKNKYNLPKYRFVVRFSNTKVVCQVVKATLAGDVVVSAAYSTELPRFGVKFGLKNYAAAYATGLLCARRLLNKYNLDKVYEGVEVANGEMYHVEEVEDAPRPFRAYLDIGLVRATTGHRVFGALKGAVDGGLDIPHSEKRFPGYNAESKEFNAEVLKKYIYGGHVADYMSMLEDEDGDKFQTQFSVAAKADISGSQLEEMYKKAHEAIRKDPVAKPTQKQASYPKAKKLRAKMSLAQRRDRTRQKLATRAKKDEE